MLVKNNGHRITVRQKAGSKGLMVGANTEVLLDGVPLKYATKFSFDVEACGLAKCKIELLGHVDLEGVLSDIIFNGKPFASKKLRKAKK